MAQLLSALRQVLLGSVVFFAGTLPVAAGDSQKMVNAGPDNVAIQGYDPVAYFTEGAPAKGKPEFSFAWNDAEWHFASAKHRDMFAADPERYAPQFGGFCSMAMSNGVKVAADPEAWTIVDGKLYLKVSKQGVEKFRRKAREYIKRAEENWVQLKSQN